MPMQNEAVIRSESRVAAVKAAAKFVAPPDAVLQDFCVKAALALKAQMAFVTFVYKETHHVVADYGFTAADSIITPGETEGTWNASVCTFVVASGSPMTFHDTQSSSMLEDCLAIDKVRSYSGAPIRFQGEVIGALGVADLVPRTISARQLKKLIKFADMISAVLKRRDEI